MRIVIDMQACQSSGSRNRGIGRYGLSLAQSIVRNKKNHEVILVLNGSFVDSVISIQEIFKDILPTENIKVWYPTGSVSYIESTKSTNNWDRNVSELLREAFFESLNPDLILVMSLFEGLDDNAVTSIGKYNKEIPTSVILYDLIPLIHEEIYLKNPAVNTWYLEKIKYLKQANLLLSISESSRKEGINYLNFDQNKIYNISTAADNQFRLIEVDEALEEQIRNYYNLNKPFILYTGGIDHRKNIERLIKAYALLPMDLRDQNQLAIVCSIQKQEKDRLLDYCLENGVRTDQVIFTGYVPENDLITLYNICNFFIFPSWHEGFGLPALEAMSCGCAVIASDCTSLPEVVGCNDALFNPYDSVAISNKMQEVLTNASFKKYLEEHALKQAQLFNWDNCAKTAITAIEEYFDKINIKQLRKGDDNLFIKRPKLAYFSPILPEKSGISYYSSELLPELSNFYDIEVISNQRELIFEADVEIKKRSIDWFLKNYSQYDRVLYHFGNSEFHIHMFDLIKQIPGVVVLHDFFLSGAISYIQNVASRPNYWIESIYQSHGYTALAEYFTVDDKNKVIMKFPCNIDVLRNAQHVIVHSEFSKQLARDWYDTDASNSWSCIPHLREGVVVTERKKISARLKLNLDVNQFVVCSFGLLGPTKLNERLLKAWLSSPLAHDENCILFFVGESAQNEYGENLIKTINKSICKDRIKITGWTDAELFNSYLKAADVGVQLRTMSRGETSGTVLDCMNYGLATIVNANGSMADLDQDSVLMLKEDFSDEELINALTTLYKDRNLCTTFGVNAKNKISSDHSPKKCAMDYFCAIEKAYSFNISDFLKEITKFSKSISLTENKIANVARSINSSFKVIPNPKKIFFNITNLLDTYPNSLNKAFKMLILSPPQGYRIEPIFYNKKLNLFCYAQDFTLDILNINSFRFKNINSPIDYMQGDVFVGFQSDCDVYEETGDILSLMKIEGVNLFSFKETKRLEVINCIHEFKHHGFLDQLECI